MPYLATFAPEAKIFQAHMQRELLENPDLIWKRDNSEIFVDRSCGRIKFLSGQPKLFDKGQSSDKSEDFEYLMQWLTGGPDGMRCQETDCYGVVVVDLGSSSLAKLMGIVHTNIDNPGAMKFDNLDGEMQAEIKTAQAKAIELSRVRVMRNIRRVWQHMKLQYEINKQDGKGNYAPSPVEQLCQYVLQKEIAAEKARTAKLTAAFEESMNELAAMPEMIEKTGAPALEETKPKRGRPKKTAQTEEETTTEV
jgi:hypothetical protein